MNRLPLLSHYLIDHDITKTDCKYTTIEANCPQGTKKALRKKVEKCDQYRGKKETPTTDNKSSILCINDMLLVAKWKPSGKASVT